MVCVAPLPDGVDTSTVLSHLLLAETGTMLYASFFNPLMTNGLSHCYHLDESIISFKQIRSDLHFFKKFSMKFL